MTRSRLLPLGALLAAAALLAGCITVFPKAKPAQLYRFEAQAGAPVVVTDKGPDRGPRVNLVLPPPSFPRSAAGDQLLTATGQETAYVAGARWIAPAQVLFEESTRRAFAGRSNAARLVGRSELGAAEAFLRLDVSDFEARYSDPAAPPTVHVVIRGLLTHKNGTFAAERTFTADVPASDNRVGPIVAAYSAAVDRVTTELINWTDANAQLAAAAPPALDGVTATTSTTSTTTVRRPNTR